MKRLLDKFHTAFYILHVKTWVRLIVTLVSRGPIVGMENVPKTGPCIMASNHMNIAEVPLISAHFPRRIVWMAKKELFQTPVINLLYILSGQIPVKRKEADMKALRLARRALKRGHVLGMFPEGTRSKDHVLHEAEPGTALIALTTGAPIVPVAVWGTENVKLPRDFFRITRVNLRVGEPFTLPETRRATKEDIERGSHEIMRRIAELLPAEYRGAYTEAVAEPVSTARGEA
jgi:1-acyl-sn-glycerol-3-phosphate acyltransferase